VERLNSDESVDHNKRPPGPTKAHHKVGINSTTTTKMEKFRFERISFFCLEANFKAVLLRRPRLMLGLKITEKMKIYFCLLVVQITPEPTKMLVNSRVKLCMGTTDLCQL